MKLGQRETRALGAHFVENSFRLCWVEAARARCRTASSGRVCPMLWRSGAMPYRPLARRLCDVRPSRFFPTHPIGIVRTIRHLRTPPPSEVKCLPNQIFFVILFLYIWYEAPTQKFPWIYKLFVHIIYLRLCFQWIAHLHTRGKRISIRNAWGKTNVSFILIYWCYAVFHWSHVTFVVSSRKSF